MKIGTKSLLAGAHCLLIHPLFVWRAWWRLFGVPWDPRILCACFLHDIGYFGRDEIEGPTWRRTRSSGRQTHGLAVRTPVGGRVREAFPVLVQENWSAGDPARSGG